MTPSGGWGTGQACVNGHQIAGDIARFPEFAEDFCSQCGASTISACESCGAPLRGYYLGELVTNWELGKFCPSCGQAYPWQAAGIEAGKELAAVLEGLSPDERDVLTRSFDDLVRDTPRTPLAAARVKVLLAKLGGEGARALREVLVSVATEAAKRQIF